MASPFKLVREGRKAVEKATEKVAKKAAPKVVREAKTTAKADRLKAPAVQTKGTDPMVQKIYDFAEQVRDPRKEYLKPVTEPVFGPADPELTKELVPQRSVAAELPPVPADPSKLPLKQRSRPILEATPEIGARMAEDLKAAGGGELPFYSTGSVIQGLVDRAGKAPGEALDFMRRWSGQGAATSPRTKTPQNLRNASYLLFREAQGDPLTYEKWLKEGEGFKEQGYGMNRPGFAMIGESHLPRSEEFFAGTNDPWLNPKPYTFRENWAGNMADVTVDTHNIRKVLDTYDKLFPGTLQRQWFRSGKAGNPDWLAYQEGKGFSPEGQLPGGIEDSLANAVVPGTGRKAQTEYQVMAGPTREAARLLGISPAEAQERLWFEGGPRTGLESPRMTIPELLNAQFETTARVLGISPEQVMKLWAKHGIPLAQNEPSDVPGASQTA